MTKSGNPYHDKRGRFSTANGSAGPRTRDVSYGRGKPNKPPTTQNSGIKIDGQEVVLHYWDNHDAVKAAHGSPDGAMPFSPPCVTAQVGDKVVGFVEWVKEYKFEGADNSTQGEIGLIDTNKEHRRKGIGSAMMKFAKLHEPKLHRSNLESYDGTAFFDALDQKGK